MSDILDTSPVALVIIPDPNDIKWKLSLVQGASYDHDELLVLVCGFD